MARTALMIDLTIAGYRDACANYVGFCANCGSECDACEPDTRNRECDACGVRSVFGAQELLVMDQINFVD